MHHDSNRAGVVVTVARAQLALYGLSALVSRLATERRPGSSSEIEIRERLPGVVADDETGVVVLLDCPWWWEPAR